MPRPIILGIVGDSASGKTTLSKGLVRLLGEEVVTHICTDDYHKYDRKQRAERAITPLDPGLQLPRHHGRRTCSACTTAIRSSSPSTSTTTGRSGR